MMENQNPISLSDVLESVETPEGRARLAKHLACQPFPHFEQHPEIDSALTRIDKDGTRTFGHFVGRVFVELE